MLEQQRSMSSFTRASVLMAHSQESPVPFMARTRGFALSARVIPMGQIIQKWETSSCAPVIRSAQSPFMAFQP